MSVTDRARRNRLDARLAKLRRRLILFGIPSGPQAIIFSEGSPPVVVERDDALRRMAIGGWSDESLDHWRAQLHDPAQRGVPVFYIAPERDEDGDAACLAWELPDTPESNRAGDVGWRQHHRNWN